MSAARVLPMDLLEDQAYGADVLEKVERRFEPAMIERLLELGLERNEVFSVVIPARTLQHRRSRKERLTVEESDRVIRLLRVLKLADEFYGSRERALAWLRRPNPRLDPAARNQLFVKDGRTPMSLLTTDTGARMVEQLLVQIDEGMFI
jgi:putative toxin-antitoxin system antitoxin component (TIGR02293 family)